MLNCTADAYCYAGCGGSDVTESGSPTPPAATPTATPTSVPTATPTPAPLSFRDLLDMSETEEVVITTYSLITGSNVYGYESHIHRLYIKDGVILLNDKETNFSYVEDFEFEFLHALYHGAFIDAATAGKGISVSQYKQRVLEHLQSRTGCYVEDVENNFRVIYQIGDTLYLLEVSSDADGVNTCWFIYAMTFAE